jgi:hypothetical protein
VIITIDNLFYAFRYGVYAASVIKMMEKVKGTTYAWKQEDEPVPALFCIIPIGVIEAKCLQKDDWGKESVHRALINKRGNKSKLDICLTLAQGLRKVEY